MYSNAMGFYRLLHHLPRDASNPVMISCFSDLLRRASGFWWWHFTRVDQIATLPASAPTLFAANVTSRGKPASWHPTIAQQVVQPSMPVSAISSVFYSHAIRKL
jgi:hypothetical protein